MREREKERETERESDRLRERKGEGEKEREGASVIQTKNIDDESHFILFLLWEMTTRHCGTCISDIFFFWHFQ